MDKIRFEILVRVLLETMYEVRREYIGIKITFELHSILAKRVIGFDLDLQARVELDSIASDLTLT